MVFFGAGNALPAHRPYSAGVVPAEAGAAAPQSDAVRAETSQPATGVFDELSSALASARAAFSNFLDLMSLEARRAGLALMWIAIWGFVAAICIVATWLGLMAALAIWAVSLGFPPVAAVIAVAVINLVAGVVLIYMCIDISRDLLFSATRRQVAGKSPIKPPAT